jgi:hypothetical protein
MPQPSKSPSKAAKAAKAPKAAKVAFGKKNQPPAVDEFAARLPLALGKRLENVRTFLLKQKTVTEDVYYYGPKSGWALRYLIDGKPLCALFVHGDRPLGIVSVDTGASAAVDWKALSPIGQKARKVAHGSPSLLWLDVALDGPGEKDFKAIVKAKLGALAG